MLGVPESRGYAVNRIILDKPVTIPQKTFFDFYSNDGKLHGHLTEDTDKVFIVWVPYDPAIKNISFYSTGQMRETGLLKPRLSRWKRIH